jgi:hypothetical protein
VRNWFQAFAFTCNLYRYIVGAQRPNQRGGRHATAARASAAAARGDVLGGLRPGEIPVGGRNRRHRRRGGWAKRAAVKVAVGQNKGKYWCEFGELMTPKLAAKFGGQRPADPGGVVGGGGGSGGGGIGGGGGGAGDGHGLRGGPRLPAPPGGVASAAPPAGVYKRAGWIAPDKSVPPPMGSLMLALTSLSLRL